MTSPLSSHSSRISIVRIAASIGEFNTRKTDTQ